MNKFYWGKKSSRELEGAAPVLRRVLNRALGYGVIDMAVAQTIRGKQEQNLYFTFGMSELEWPDSAHEL